MKYLHPNKQFLTLNVTVYISKFLKVSFKLRIVYPKTNNRMYLKATCG